MYRRPTGYNDLSNRYDTPYSSRMGPYRNDNYYNRQQPYDERYDNNYGRYNDSYNRYNTNRPYNERLSTQPDEDWRRRRFDRSATDPHQSGSNKLFGGLSLLASEYDIRRINILLFLLGCGGVTLFVLWKKYVSKWIRQWLYTSDSRLDALLPKSETPAVTDINEDDAMLIEFKEYSTKRKPKAPVPKEHVEIDENEIEKLVELVEEKFEQVQKEEASLETSNFDGITYLSQLEQMTREELEEMYKKQVRVA